MLSCKKPYNAPATSTSNSYLVVEGAIIGGADSTIIKLSKTVNLASKTTTNPVTGALVTVENDQNASYPLTENGNGKYSLGGLGLDAARQYRIRVKTSAGKQYVSDFVAVYNSPPIDSLGYTAQSDGAHFYINTHDANNNARYFQWSYQETWVFHTAYSSGYVSNGDTVIERILPGDQVYQCWGNDTSSNIVLGSTANLTRDVLTNYPITFVASTSEKFSSEYSIIVKQASISGTAYQYLQNLKKNTEELGGIFDAQPSEIEGNIHSVTNPSETVIGYISAGNVASKRIFISARDLPAWLPTPMYTDCLPDTAYLKFQPAGYPVPINQENQYFNYDQPGFELLLIPVGAVYLRSPISGYTIIGHWGAFPECVDCTLRGTNKKPAFWPY